MHGPPDLGFPTAGIGMSLPCPEGEQARRMVARFHPLCDTLAAPCRMGSREALRIQIVFPLWFTHVLFGGRYAELAFVRGSIAREPVPGVTLNSRGRPLVIYPHHTSTSRPTLIIRRF